jgi:hypothetical protein
MLFLGDRPPTTRWHGDMDGYYVGPKPNRMGASKSLIVRQHKLQWGLPSLCRLGAGYCASPCSPSPPPGLGTSSTSAPKGTSFSCDIDGDAISMLYVVSTVRCAGTLFCFGVGVYLTCRIVLFHFQCLCHES